MIAANKTTHRLTLMDSLRRPATQAQRRNDILGKGVAPPEQQISTGHQCHRHHDGIKHHKNRVFLYLIVHLVKRFVRKDAAKVQLISETWPYQEKNNS